MAYRYHVWAIVPAHTEQDWCVQLGECGTALVSALPTSPMLAVVLRRSAAVFATRGAYRLAEMDGLRELAIWRKLDDYEGAVDVLTRLAVTFRARDRLHRVIDCADEVLAWSARHGDQRGVAWALGNLGSIMLEVGWVDSAIGYATRAQDAVEALPDVPAQQRAEAAVLLGRALWASGAESVARRRFSHALALLVDVDDAAADRVRVLLGAPTGTRLPELLVRGPDHPQDQMDQ